MEPPQQAKPNFCALSFDPETKSYLFVDPNISSVLGYEAANFYQNVNLISEIIALEDQEKVKNQSKQQVPGEWIEMRYKVLSANGQLKTVTEKKSLIIDGRTGKKFLLSLFNDHPSEMDDTPGNDFKRLVEHGFLFEDNPTPMWIYEKTSFKILKVNKAAMKMYGYSEDEFFSMSITDFLHSSEIGKFRAYVNEKGLLETHLQGANNSGVWMQKKRNNDLVFAEITSENITYNSKNCRIIAAQNITETEKIKEQARYNEQFLNSLIDSQTNLMIRINTSGIYTFINKQFTKVFGFEKDDVIGKHYTLTTLPEEDELFKKAFYDCLNDPLKIINLIHKKPDKSGLLHDTEWEFISILNEDGKVNEIQGIGQDITERVRTAKEAKQTGEQLEKFVESLPDSFFVIDKNWKFAKVNNAFEKLADLKREQIIGKYIWEILGGIMGTGFEYAFRKAADENISVQVTDFYRPLQKWFSSTIYPSDEGLTVFERDVTEEKRAQQEVVRTVNSLSALINNTEDHIWSVDIEKRYVYMNQAYRKSMLYFTGFEPGEGDSSNMHKGFSLGTVTQWNNYYSRALKGECYSITDQRIDPLTGKEPSFEVSFNPIYEKEEEITGVGCFARNITGRLETERSIRSQNERLREIASLSSHQLRRPVASLLGLINILDHDNFSNPENEIIINYLFAVGNEIDEVIRLVVDKTFTDFPIPLKDM